MSDLKKIILLFIGWRIYLFIILLLSFQFLPLGNTDRYLGGGFINYNKFSLIFPWANFDGEHYISIAIFGYKGLEQAFFPAYPFLISIFSRPFSYDLLTSLLVSSITGLIISNVFFVIDLYLLYKLVKIDFSSKISFRTLLLLTMFPTSFYFGAVYNESLLLFLIIGSFYAARKDKWYLVCILAAIASATKIFGLLLFPALLVEWWQQRRRVKDLFWIFLSPVGLLLYMLYQYYQVGDPIAFYHLQGTIGEQRQLGVIFLPQVFYRYIKMILTVDPTNPIYQTIILEFITGVIFTILPIYGYFKKIRLSYIFFALAGLMLSPLQGSLSSVPRYVLILFPSFISLSLLINNLPKIFKLTIFLILGISLLLETSLFLRGYWVA